MTASGSDRQKAISRISRQALSHYNSVLILATLTILRLIVAAWMPLSADEAYYRLWAHALAGGYPDHPPLVALFIRAGIGIAGDTALGVRLMGPVAALLGSLLLVRAGTDLASQSAGWRATWMLNATLLCNAGAVVMTPDTPLLLFWTACLACLCRVIRTGNPLWWLAAGIAAGLAMDSKYTGFLLGPAILAWTLASADGRRWLRRWQPYAGAGLAALLFSPVLVWNASHHWVSFIRQGGRGADFHADRAAHYVAELLLGQFGLATPLLAFVFSAAIIDCVRHRAWVRQETGLLATVTILPALVFAQHALGGRVQANWPGVIYPGAALAAGLVPGRFWRPAIGLGACLSAALFLQATAAPFPLRRRVDFTLIRLAGWGDLARDAEAAAQAQEGAFVAADEYGLAAELAFHLRHVPAIATGVPWTMIGLPHESYGGRTGILVRSDRDAGQFDPTRWPGAVPVGRATRERRGIVAETYRLYRVQLPARAPMVVLSTQPAIGG